MGVLDCGGVQGRSGAASMCGAKAKKQFWGYSATEKSTEKKKIKKAICPPMLYYELE